MENLVFEIMPWKEGYIFDLQSPLNFCQNLFIRVGERENLVFEIMP